MVVINKTSLDYTLTKNVKINVLERFYLVLKSVVVVLDSVVVLASVVVAASVVVLAVDIDVELGSVVAVVFELQNKNY